MYRPNGLILNAGGGKGEVNEGKSPKTGKGLFRSASSRDRMYSLCPGSSTVEK